MKKILRGKVRVLTTWLEHSKANQSKAAFDSAAADNDNIAKDTSVLEVDKEPKNC